MASLLPALIGGLERNTMTRDGIADLMQALSAGHHQTIITDPNMIGHPDALADGKAIIGHILGPQGFSQEALQAAARQSGVPLQAMGGIGPMIAIFLLGWLFRNAGGLLGNVLGSVLGGAGGGGGMQMPQFPQFPSGGGQDMPQGFPQMPPMGQSAPRSGAPGMPGGLPDIRNFDTRNNPYGPVADSIRRGGSSAGQSSSIIRDILGNLLGFGSSSGWMGWVVKFLVLRFGWTILRGILGSVLRGR
jgi:hypothetical protein